MKYPKYELLADPFQVVLAAITIFFCLLTLFLIIYIVGSLAFFLRIYIETKARQANIYD